jgi:hypothetical protein
MSVTSATTPPGDQQRLSPWVPILLSLLVYAWLLVGAEAVVRVTTLHHHPELRFLRPDRRQFLFETALAEMLLVRVAVLSLPLMLLAVLTRRRHPDPAADLGLVRPGGAGLLAAGVLGGVGLHLATLALTMALGAGLAAPATPAAVWQALARNLALGPWYVASILLLAVCFAVSRTLVPFGHLDEALRVALPRPYAAGLAAVVFAAPYAANGFFGPLAAANTLLLGLVLARLRRQGDGLHLPLGVVLGLVASGHLLGAPMQGVPSAGATLFDGLPAVLGGGSYGLDAGLPATVVLLAWLAWLVRPRPAEPTTPRPA